MKQVNTPASNNLFRVRKDSEDILLSNEKASIFHSIIAKLLFLAKQGRPDILLAVSFLTTRVKKPDSVQREGRFILASYSSSLAGC